MVRATHGGMKEIFMPSIEETPGKGWKAAVKRRGGRLVGRAEGKMLSRVGTGDVEEP